MDPFQASVQQDLGYPPQATYRPMPTPPRPPRPPAPVRQAPVPPSRQSPQPPAKKKRKGGIGWRIVFFAAIIVLVCALGGLGWLLFTYWNGQNSVGDFGAEYGCVFLEGVNSGDWTDQVNVIYAHHMANGSMFALLADFAWNSELFNQHRTFYVLTPEGNFHMTSFAVNKVLGSSTDIVIPTFSTEEGLESYVQARLDANIVEPADPPAPAASEVRQIFAFSTCSEPDNSYRIVTFCTVDEFLPAGSNVALGNSLVDEGHVADVAGDVAERTL